MTAFSDPGTRIVLMGTGTHRAESGLAEVPAVATALADLERILIDRCGVVPENVRVVIDPTTPTEMGLALAEQAEQAESILLVYYVGHGLVSPSGELYLATHSTDRRPSRLAHTSLAYTAVRNCLLESQARSIVVVLDCCFSGRALGSLGDPEEDVALFAHVSGGFVLTSAARDEVALAPPGQRYTAFTGELIDLLKLGDPEGPRELTLRYVYRYLSRALPAKGLPRPRRQTTEGADDLVLTTNPAWQPPVSDPGIQALEVSDQANDTPNICPYPGLAAYSLDEARWFFGRKRATDELLSRLTERLDRSGPLVLVAPSGTGKSSLLRAGLLPAIRGGALPIPGSQSWPMLLFTPTSDPIRELANQIAGLVAADAESVAEELVDDPARLAVMLREAVVVRAAGDQVRTARAVIVVDQFEETFTLCAEENRRQIFIRALCVAANGGSDYPPPALVVLGLRADFYGRCAAYPELVATVRHGQILLDAMSPDELRDAIEKPAQAVGLAVQSGVVEVLLRDLGADAHSSTKSYDPGSLPLFAHALLATWQYRQGGILTLHGYQLAGGLQGAIAATAERTYQDLDPVEQKTAHQLLLSMVQVGENALTTRRVDLEQLISQAIDPLVAGTVLEELARARLVTLAKTTVELIHEALLHDWPRLRDWIETNRAELLLRQQLTHAAETWDREGRHPSALYQGPRLVAAREVTTSPELHLSTLVNDFLDASIRLEEYQQRTTRRRTRRLRHGILILAILFTFAVTTTIVAINSQKSAVQAEQTATQQRDLALSRKVASEALTLQVSNPSLAVQLSLAAYRLSPTAEARAALLGIFGTSYPTVPVGSNNDDMSDFVSVKFSYIGHVLVTAFSHQRSVRLWDVTDPRNPNALSNLDVDTSSAAISSDGKTLAIGGEDGTVRLWDVTSPRRPIALGSFAAHSSLVTSVIFSPDKRTVATSGYKYIGPRNCLPQCDPVAEVQLWDATDLHRPAPLATMTGHIAVESPIAFSHDGRILATNSDLAAGTRDGATLWDVTDPRKPGALSTFSGHTGAIHSITFSRQGWTLATGSEDGAALWDVTDPRKPGALSTFSGHTYYADAVEFSPDGRTLATSSDDKNTRLWDVTDPRRPVALATFSRHLSRVGSLAFSPDGHTLATGSGYGIVRLQETNIESVVELVCDVAQPLITQSEWEHYFPNLEYRPSCQ